MDSLSGAPSSAPVADVSQPKNRTLQQSQLNSLTADLGQPSASPTTSPTLPMSPTIAQGQTPFGGFGTATSWPQSLMNLLGGMASQWAPQNTGNGVAPPGTPGATGPTPPYQTTQVPPGFTGSINQPGYSNPQLGGFGNLSEGMGQGVSGGDHNVTAVSLAKLFSGPWGNNLQQPGAITQQPGMDQVVQPAPQTPPVQPPPVPQQPPQQPQQPAPASQTLPQDRTPNGTPTPQSMGFGPQYRDSPADQAARRTVQGQQGEQEARFMRESQFAGERGQDLYNSQLAGGNAYTSPFGANPNELNQMAALGMNLPSANNPAYWASLGVQAPSYLSNYYDPVTASAQPINGAPPVPPAINPVMTNGPLPNQPPPGDNPNAPNSPFLDPNWGALNVQGTPALGNAFNTVQDQLNSGLINWNSQLG